MGRFTRRILMFLLAVMLASPVVIAAPPAKAGINHCAGIWANNNRVVVQHLSRCAFASIAASTSSGTSRINRSVTPSPSALMIEADLKSP